MRRVATTPAFICMIALGCLALSNDGRAEQAAQSSQALQTPHERFATLETAGNPSFRRHLVPLLARQGCSARECHGSFQGRGGFQLSLFGSEWDHDFLQLTQSKGDEDQTHIDPAQPDQSLLLLKPTLQVKHKGKERIKKGSWQYNLVLKWIRDGAKNDAEKTGELARLEITPGETVFNKVGQQVQLRVLAHWTDGTVEDVTDLTRFKTNDETVAVVSESGVISCVGKGDSHIVASYDNGVVPIPVMLPVSEFAGARYPSVATHGRVDELVVNKLRKLGVVPSELSTDAEFLRRVSLDLTGTLPAPQEIIRFIADPSPVKRAAKIEELLATPAYAAWWATKFCDYTGASPRELNFGNNFGRNPAEMTRQWYNWIYKRVAANLPYDQLIEGIVVSASRTSPDQTFEQYSRMMNGYFRSDHPQDYADHPTMPYFWQRRNLGLPQDKALAFAHSFLGIRIECAQCHKHPFDRWTKQDFAQFTAFFLRIASSPKPAEGNEVCYSSIAREMKDQAEAKIEQTEGPVKAPNGKFNPKVYQKVQSELNAEMKRRIDAGEPVPWQEMWMDTRLFDKFSKKAIPKGPLNPFQSPKILGDREVPRDSSPDLRVVLMDWLRSKDNPYFAKALVNRVWSAYFNRGIVDPPDDMNLANAPCNGELLDYLAQGFIAHGYDMKWLHREILSSDTYQRSWQVNATNRLDNRNFSHKVVRQLPAEVMFDAIEMAIGPESKLDAYRTQIGNRAIGPDGAAQFTPKGRDMRSRPATPAPDPYFLALFGTPAREANCDCERSTDPTLLQTLFTRNDPSLLSRIEGSGRAEASWVSELRGSQSNAKTAAGPDLDSLITQTFLRTVSRLPTKSELADARRDVASQKNPIDGIRDLLWAMVNTREFKVNH